MNGKRGNGAGRKKGDWQTVAKGRAHIQRDLINGRGLSNIPSVTDVGSAAYRRLMKRGKHGSR